MLITKFNALIRNRFIWGFFAVLVSITMVGFFTNSGGCQGTQQQVRGTIGTLNGQPVTGPALQASREHVLLRLRLSTGRDFEKSPEMNKLLTHEAWKRIALLQLAESEKLWASDIEVGAAIQRDPMFQVEGAFNRARFNQFIEVLGRNLNISADQFWSYLREELTLEKIRRTVAAGMWTAPSEVDRLARNFADSFTVDYAEANAGALTRDITVTEAQIKAYYDTHLKDFTIPDLARVAYTAFSFADYAALEPSPEAMTNYYAEHMNDFYYTNQAGKAEFRKIEDVEPLIRGKVAAGLQREKAIEDASRFAETLYDRSSASNFFYAAAAATGKTVRLTRYFSIREPLRELAAGLDFNSAAFSLGPEKDANFSEPIVGSNTVYVLAYDTVKPSRIPSFTESREEAEARALAEARSQALEERAAKIASQVKESVRAGKPFADAVKAASLTGAVKTAGPFTAYTAPEPFDNARLVTAIISLQEGDVSEFTQSEKGTLFLIRCKTRTAGDPGALDPIRNQIRASVNRRHSQLLISQWEEDLLKKMGFKEQAAAAPETDETGENEPEQPVPSNAGQL